MRRHLSGTRDFVWERFDLVRTKQSRGDIRRLQSHIVSLTLHADCTHRQQLEAITSSLQPPLAIESLSDKLDETQFPRGKTIFRSSVGDAIDDIAANYEHMFWWLSEHGLNMNIVLPEPMPLSRFDELASKLYVEGSEDGRLSKELLTRIARQLDSSGFSLKELQPAQLKIINGYNQKNSRKAIKTFVAVCANPRLARSIRRRLYVSRSRYLKTRAAAN